MPRYYEHVKYTYIADGFSDDCQELIHQCLKTEPLDFQTFCKIWKDMNFGSAYQGRQTGCQIAELSEELIHVAKRFMLDDTSTFEESVVGLFLVYGLQNLQPYSGFAALRLVPEDVPAITHMESVARRERRFDVLYILGAVLIKGPCQYHADVRERGMESSIRKYLEGSPLMEAQRPKGIFARKNDEFDALKEFDGVVKKYIAAKSCLTTVQKDDRNLKYFDEKLPGVMESTLRQVISGLGPAAGEVSEEDEELDSVQAIKRKAMSSMVSNMKHLTAIQNRTMDFSPKQKPGTSSKSEAGGKSPKKPITSTKKRSKNKKSKKSKKRKMCASYESESESDMSNEMSDLYDDDDEPKSSGLSLNIIGDDVPDDETDPGSEKERIAENQKSGLKDINIDNLNVQDSSMPIYVTTEADKLIEIEVIDNYKGDKAGTESIQSEKSEAQTLIQSKKKKSQETIKAKAPKGKSNGEKLKMTKELGESSQSTDNAQIAIAVDSDKAEALNQTDDETFERPCLKKPEKREQKRRLLKSRLKRMGILSVTEGNEM